MKYKYFAIIFFLYLLVFNTKIFSEGIYDNNVKTYMESKNQTYPIHIDTSLKNSFYRDWTKANIKDDEGFYPQIVKPMNDFDLELTSEQRNKLERFISKIMTDSECIDEIKRMFITNTFSIDNIVIEHYDWNEKDYIILSIVNYSNYKVNILYKYNEENKIWTSYNTVYCHFENDIIEFLGTDH